MTEINAHPAVWAALGKLYMAHELERLESAQLRAQNAELTERLEKTEPGSED